MPLNSSDMVAEGSTILTMEGLGVPPYSARGLSQTLEPIDISKQTRRTINGSLKDLSVSQFHKYKSTITGKDVDPPAVSGRWPGQIVQVECIAELCYRTADGPAPERAAVAGSTRVEGDFTFYRPVLSMRVLSFQWNTDEWTAEVSWSMELEEI
jgi:hypothetical protein